MGLYTFHRRAAVLVFACVLFSSTHAIYVQTCKVKYETKDGWSDYYTVEVKFLTGRELNKATETYDYNTYSKYAVIFWGEGKASVIELEGYFSCGTEVERDCIADKPLNLEGEDQEERKWVICVKSTCY
jgi:hypothetical protein